MSSTACAFSYEDTYSMGSSELLDWINSDSDASKLDSIFQGFMPATAEVPTISAPTGVATTYKLCRNNICEVGGNDKVLTLTNYDNAKNPTYEQLIKFAKEDHTETIPYTSTFVCSDFAVTFHDRAEKAGIRSGFVAIDSMNHAFNVFETTDKGTVYIDCTADSSGEANVDKQVFVQEGKVITSKYLFNNYGTFSEGVKPSGIILFW